MFENINLPLIVMGASFLAVVLVIAYPLIAGDDSAEKRKSSLIGGRAVRVDQDMMRRRNVTQALKALDQPAKKRITLDVKLAQSGLGWSRRQFFIFSILCAAICFLIILLISLSLLQSILGLLIGGFGVPHWYLSHRKKKRLNRFIEEFPGVLDIIIRGIRAGLPLSECLKIVANEAPEPLKSEFKQIIESQQMGMTLTDATFRMAERTPCSESNFYAIALGIQQQSGGNISETLHNLSRVLRDRKKMKTKIKAMSMEALASAGIIACMPPGVGLMVYFANPEYISLLWTTTTGQITLMVCGIWMLFGILVMKKMISFEV
jgi:tight adherence protein B